MLLEVVEDDVVRRVVGLADLLQDHAALALKFLRFKRGVGQDVADDVGGERRVFLQHLHVIGGLFARRVGVDVAADRLDLLGDLHRRPTFGALERHVFEEMRDAVLRLQFVARASRDVRSERDGLDPLHPFGDDGKAGGELCQLDGFGHCWRVPE